ncbi:MAG: hypothetical protein MUE42_15950, partial [Opitutaceae bacterium]|nr:hypothetical protein [Opitutaceae bacterium]
MARFRQNWANADPPREKSWKPGTGSIAPVIRTSPVSKAVSASPAAKAAPARRSHRSPSLPHATHRVHSATADPISKNPVVGIISGVSPRPASPQKQALAPAAKAIPSATARAAGRAPPHNHHKSA